MYREPKLISHRGNTSGAHTPEFENRPDCIDYALKTYECEVDLWVIDNFFYLGHDKPQYKVDYRWLDERATKLWIHCKNMPAFKFCRPTPWHYFWHDTDQYTLTSKNIIWSYPTALAIPDAIIAVPESFHGIQGTIQLLKTTGILGICTDHPQTYKAMLDPDFKIP